MDDFFDEIPEHVGGRVYPASFPVLKKSEAATMPSRKPADWKRRISEISRADAWDPHSTNAWPAKREVLYIVSVSGDGVSAVLSLESHDQKKNGDWNSPRPLALKRSLISLLPLPEDREILSALLGGETVFRVLPHTYDSGPISFLLSPVLARTLLPRVGPYWALLSAACKGRGRDGGAGVGRWPSLGIRPGVAPERYRGDGRWAGSSIAGRSGWM